MIFSCSSTCSLFAFVFRLSKKPLDQIIYWAFSARIWWYLFNKEITKKYHEHKIQRLSFKIKNRKRSIGAGGRPFKLDLKDRFLMLLIYYRLYITYTLASFLFDLGQSNICSRDIQKIRKLIIQCLPIPQKIYNITKRLKTLEEV